MAKKDAFGVLVATDGSFTAQAAIGAAVGFPWPAPSRVRAVIGLRTITRGGDFWLHDFFSNVNSAFSALLEGTKSS
jgi:hypothetical protein